MTHKTEIVQDQIAKLNTDISTLMKQNYIKINILTKVHLKEMEELRSENIILKQELTSIFKFHCDVCEYKSLEYTALKCHKNIEHEDKMKLLQEKKVPVIENQTVSLLHSHTLTPPPGLSSDRGVVRVPHCQPEAFQALLQYVYLPHQTIPVLQVISWL